MWIFENKEITNINDFPTESFGFIYKIYNCNNNKCYIGKKFLFHTIKRKVNGKLKKVKKESDWKSYNGSNKFLKLDIENGDIIKKEILYICKTKKQLTYYELKYLFLESVLESEQYYNDNISGKFYRRDL